MDMRQTWGEYQVVLASASPRRKELITQVGLKPEIRSDRMEEEAREKKPDRVAMELSRQKAEDAASGCPGGTMAIGAGTVVSVGNEILGKPGIPMRTYETLGKIQGRTHQAYTGVTVLLCQGKGKRHRVVFAGCMDVYVYPITCGEMEEYVQCGEPLDRAGTYGIQGRFAAHTKGIDGNYVNVVGLSVGRFHQEIKRPLEDGEND